MSEQENIAWRERLKHKPFRYWIRDEIEEIIKEEAIDRSRFHESGKTEYAQILREVYYTFVDYKKYRHVTLDNLQLHFHERLQHTQPVCCTDWMAYIRSIADYVPEEEQKQAFYFLVNDSWVYEGYLPEIISILLETDGLLEDFYIVSKKYDWMIVHSDDGDCMYRVTIPSKRTEYE